MARIPVGETIGYAYRYAFSQFLILVRLSWVPLALAQAINLYSRWFASVASANDSGEGTLLRLLSPHIYFPALVEFVCFGFITTIYIMHALATPIGQGSRAFPPAKPILRVMATWLSCTLIISVANLAIFTVLSRINVMAFEGGHRPILLLTNLAGIALRLFTIYINVRLFFLLPSVVVAEETMNPLRIWQIGRGNFWRLFVIQAALMLPFGLIYLGIFTALLGTDYLTLIGSLVSNPFSIGQRTSIESTKLAREIYELWPLVMPLGFVLSATVYGALAGASSKAYRKLTTVTDSA